MNRRFLHTRSFSCIQHSVLRCRLSVKLALRTRKFFWGFRKTCSYKLSYKRLFSLVSVVCNCKQKVLELLLMHRRIIRAAGSRILVSNQSEVIRSQAVISSNVSGRPACLCHDCEQFIHAGLTSCVIFYQGYKMTQWRISSLTGVVWLNLNLDTKGSQLSQTNWEVSTLVHLFTLRI